MGKPSKQGNKARPHKTTVRPLSISPALERIEAFLLEVEGLCVQLRDTATALRNYPTVQPVQRARRFFMLTQRVAKATDFLFRLTDEYKAITNPLMRTKILYWYKALYAYLQPLQQALYVQGAWALVSTPGTEELPDGIPAEPWTAETVPQNPWR